LVISGSCSPVTDRQIGRAVAAGFAEVALDTDAIVSSDCASRYLVHTAQVATERMARGQSVIIHTSRGHADPRIAASARALERQGMAPAQIQTATPTVLGGALGLFAKLVMSEVKVRRLVIAGGDTSGHAARQLGIEALEMIAPLSPGAPLCRASAPGSPADGIEVNFKGGQVGAEDYFLIAAGLAA
jgi:uncharacterized protein YgbK (DUF1537 family)